MTGVPVPTFDPLPSAVEIAARGLHATKLRRTEPGITDRQILVRWDAMLPETRERWLREAQAAMEERLAAPAEPDDVEALVARLRRSGGAGEEPHHAAARLPTDEERAALRARALACATLADLRRAAAKVRRADLGTDEERRASAPRMATGGAIRSGTGGNEPPSWLTGCAYDNGGRLPSGLEWWRNDTGQPINLDGSKPFPPTGLTRVLTGGVCEVHGTPLTRTDDLPSAEQPQGHRWRCLADGDKCTTSHWDPALWLPDGWGRDEEWTMRYRLDGEPRLAEEQGHVFSDRADAERHIDVWRRQYPDLTYTDVEYLRRDVLTGPWEAAEQLGEVVHRCPPGASGVMPCCGRTPFEAPGDRMTVEPALVTCNGPHPADLAEAGSS